MKLIQTTVILIMGTALLAAAGSAQVVTLLPPSEFHAIRNQSSGEEPIIDFKNIVTRFTGFAPSKGGDEIAEYIAGRLRDNGVSDVKIEGFPSDGKKYYWAFIGEPSWECESAILEMVKPRGVRLANFAVNRQAIGRYSTSADITSEVIDVGSGIKDSDYLSKDVKGKIVLASGNAEFVHRLAVWKYGAAGLVMAKGPEGEGGGGAGGGMASLGNRTGGPAYIPWRSPTEQSPGFLFTIPPSLGTEIRQLLRQNQPVVLHAAVKTTLGAGEYKQVTATVRGTDPSLPEVWVKGHDNYRNGGGGNNLTGVGAVIEVARVLTKLVNDGTIPRPKRTIRFLWSAEHFGDVMTLHEHPELRDHVLAFFSVDMVGFDQAKANAAQYMRLLPHSLPHFLGDVTEDFFRAVGDANIATGRNSLNSPLADPTFAPNGTKAEMRYAVEDFWGPSDHEEMNESSIGIPSIEFGHPLHYASPDDDNFTGVDPTQMRRMVTIIAATADYLASADATGIPHLASVIASKAQGRIGSEARRAIELIRSASNPQESFRDAINILAQSHEREINAIESLHKLGESPEAQAAIARAKKQLDVVYANDEESFRKTAAQLAANRSIILKGPTLTEAERRLSTLTVKRNEKIRGPVNLFRPEYGAIWLAEQTGDDNFASKLKITALGRFTAYEALNFVDGKRNLLEIRDLTSGEFGAIDPAAIEEYFRFLERVGVVSISSAKDAR